jgi:hypothetical protein
MEVRFAQPGWQGSLRDVPVLDINTQGRDIVVQEHNSHREAAKNVHAVLLEDWPPAEEGSAGAWQPQISVVPQCPIDGELQEPLADGRCLIGWVFVVQFEYVTGSVKMNRAPSYELERRSWFRRVVTQDEMGFAVVKYNQGWVSQLITHGAVEYLDVPVVVFAIGGQPLYAVELVPAPHAAKVRDAEHV